jgi:hypothetical protein
MVAQRQVMNAPRTPSYDNFAFRSLPSQSTRGRPWKRRPFRVGDNGAPSCDAPSRNVLPKNALCFRIENGRRNIVNSTVASCWQICSGIAISLLEALGRAQSMSDPPVQIRHAERTSPLRMIELTIGKWQKVANLRGLKAFVHQCKLAAFQQRQAVVIGWSLKLAQYSWNHGHFSKGTEMRVGARRHASRAGQPLYPWHYLALDGTFSRISPLFSGRREIDEEVGKESKESHSTRHHRASADSPLT